MPLPYICTLDSITSSFTFILSFLPYKGPIMTRKVLLLALFEMRLRKVNNLPKFIYPISKSRLAPTGLQFSVLFVSFPCQMHMIVENFLVSETQGGQKAPLFQEAKVSSNLRSSILWAEIFV